MEEINKIEGINQQLSNERIVNIRASEIIKIFASPENRHAFAIENSKFIIYNYRLIFSKIGRFRCNFYVASIIRRKKGN